MSLSNGYIKLHRCIQDNPDWFAEPFTRSQAWIDMLMNASYKPHAVRIRGIKIDLARGQLALSEVEYSKRWKWSRGKVNRFLKELESKTVQQITQQKTNVTSVVTVINYDDYQRDDTAIGTADGQQAVQQTGSKRAADGHIQEGIRREEGKEGKEIKYTAAKLAEIADRIYKEYPRKVAKQTAIKAIIKVLKNDVDPNVLGNIVIAYAKATSSWPDEEKKYIPHPATWFNAGSWEDDQSQWTLKSATGQGADKYRNVNTAGEVGQ